MTETQHEQKTIRMIMTLVNLIELKNPFLLGHSERVAQYAALLAGELGLPDDEVDAIRLAGMLHDLGKLALPDDVLDKCSGFRTPKSRSSGSTLWPGQASSSRFSMAG